ncbi:MAG: hypothetical protein PHV13_01555 [Candidatus ainarchaeum sp.]|nr:hypothetical protein [Candidatus ainarchaeum sp.]
MAEIISAMWGDWVWFAGVSLSLITTLVALVYVLSSLLMNEKMKTWAKMELAEIFYSAVIIAVGIGGITTIDGLVQGALGVSNVGGAPGTATSMCYAQSATSAWVPVSINNKMDYKCLDICGPLIASKDLSVYNGISSCHMRLGIWYLRETFDEARDFAFDIYISYIKTSMIAEFTINIEYFTEYAGFFTFTPWRGFFTMGNTVKQLCFDWAIKIMMLCKFQEVLLRYIAVALFPALFVIGALLRAFTFTRRLGGLILAMAIALYFVFPAFYAFGALVMLDLKSKAYSDWMANDKANPNQLPDPPIANTMYINEKVTMIGGTFTSQEARQALAEYEGLEDDVYMEKVEQGQASGLLPPLGDLSATNTPTDEEAKSTLQQAYDKVSDWKDALSKEGKFDHFITNAWKENGPLDVLARITFWSLFFGLFGIIATIGVIRSISITFGGDIEIAGLTRLI